MGGVSGVTYHEGRWWWRHFGGLGVVMDGWMDIWLKSKYLGLSAALSSLKSRDPGSNV
jgi:hypothetical protein